MIIKKIQETSIDLMTPQEIFHHDIDTLLMQKLSSRYRGRCFQSIYILSIVRIIRRSSIRMTITRLDGSASVDVQYEVEGLVLNPGDVLHGCKIIEIHNNAITAEHKYVGIKLQNSVTNKISQILQVGQTIPVVVQKVRYIPHQKNISMIATPYIPTTNEDPIYRIKSALTPPEVEKLGMFVDQIDDELKLHDGIKDERKYIFFHDLMYPYKNNIKYERTQIAEFMGMKPIALNLKSLIGIKSGVVSMPSEDHLSNQRIFWSNSTKVPSELQLIDIDMYPVAASYFNRYLSYLQTLRGFVETYTADNIKQMVTYWRICKAAKS
jgi:hypothetical protein